MLDSFLSGLEMGRITYAHPRFALNKGNETFCTFPVSPNSVAAISWWSKDFKNLIESWPASEKTLNQYSHHFSFAINGPANSILEPGVNATFEERMEQLRWLVDKCIELDQDPNASILVKVDPISVYKVFPSTKEEDTLGHIPQLCEYLKAFGLTRIHISFTQFFPATNGRLRKMAKHFTIKDLTIDDQKALLEEKFFPYSEAAGIKLQTCTAMSLVEYYRTKKQGGIIRGIDIAGENIQLQIDEGHLVDCKVDQTANLIQGACVGWRDIQSITNGTSKMAFQESQVKSTRYCTCYPHRDVGDKTVACTHGCRYCFSNPMPYDF
jgi:hypothetical protein